MSWCVFLSCNLLYCLEQHSKHELHHCRKFVLVFLIFLWLSNLAYLMILDHFFQLCHFYLLCILTSSWVLRAPISWWHIKWRRHLKTKMASWKQTWPLAVFLEHFPLKQITNIFGAVESDKNFPRGSFFIGTQSHAQHFSPFFSFRCTPCW